MSVEKPEETAGGTAEVTASDKAPKLGGEVNPSATGSGPGQKTSVTDEKVAPSGGEAPSDYYEEEEPSRAPKVFGVLHLIMVGITVLLFLGSLAVGIIFRNQLDNVQMGENTRIIMQLSKEIERIPIARVNGFIMLGVTILMTALLVVAGNYLLKSKKRGQTFSIAYAIINIFFGVYHIAFSEIVMKSHYQKLLMDDGSIEITTQSFVLFWYSIGNVVQGCCCWFVYPVLILIFMLPERFGKNLK
ncbi:MAG: hypothetical protein KA419_09595 [Acidobacteria bacterium]|nr:hypothetical protein [Acidobacteriota bacterium]